MILEIELKKESGSSRHRIELPPRAEPGTAGHENRLVLDGEPVEIDWAEVTPGTYSILLEGRSYEARVAPGSGNHSGTNGAWVVTIAEHDFHLETRDPRARRFAGQAVVQEGPQEVLAPMPGKIVRILVTQGQEVAREQGLLVIEAMKMQNELRAPRSGRVTELHVREGMGIETGTKLIRLE